MVLAYDISQLFWAEYSGFGFKYTSAAPNNAYDKQNHNNGCDWWPSFIVLITTL